MLKNDEEPARHEGGKKKPSKEMFPDKAAGDTLENTFICLVFPLLEKQRTFCLSCPPPFFPNSLELFLQGVREPQRQTTAASRGTKKIDNEERGRQRNFFTLSHQIKNKPTKSAEDRMSFL